MRNCHETCGFLLVVFFCFFFTGMMSQTYLHVLWNVWRHVCNLGSYDVTGHSGRGVHSSHQILGGGLFNLVFDESSVTCCLTEALFVPRHCVAICPYLALHLKIIHLKIHGLFCCCCPNLVCIYMKSLGSQVLLWFSERTCSVSILFHLYEVLCRLFWNIFSFFFLFDREDQLEWNIYCLWYLQLL